VLLFLSFPSSSSFSERFPLALDIGSGSGYIYQAICSDDAFVGDGGIGGVRKLVQLDSSDLLLHRDEREAAALEGAHRCDTYRLHSDEEGTLPFPDGTFDLVLSSQSMQWVNDLPGLFKEVRVRRTGGWDGVTLGRIPMADTMSTRR
jgi:NADH dehydrogenase [ubiquinone] 1 alpha subcomplex assembly factor 5